MVVVVYLHKILIELYIWAYIQSLTDNAEIILRKYHCRFRINGIYLILVLTPFRMVDTVDPLLRLYYNAYRANSQCKSCSV